MENINAVNVFLIFVFILPVAAGAIRPFSKEKIQYSLGSLLDNIEFLAGIIMSIYLTKKIFFEHEGRIYKQIYEWIPAKIKELLYQQDILTYIVAVPIILLFILLLLRIFTSPLYTYVIVPLSARVYQKTSTMRNWLKRSVSAFWQIPKGIYFVLICSLAMNFYSYYFYTAPLAKWMNESEVYQLFYKNALYPVLNSNIAKQIPVLVNDSFKQTLGKVIPKDGGSLVEKIGDRLTGGNFKIIEYFNGVTIDEAIKSTPEIDAKAKEITANAKSSKNEAFLLYKWVSSNIEYDYEKAEKIVGNSEGISSGAIEAFSTGKGICFDYSCLYVSMCRAVGLKVRLATGLGYSGISWGDHAWNQVYCEEEDRWIELDATFGSAGVDYFDKSDFNVDHRYEEIQGEW